MKEKIRVSIIIPIYNTEAYLKACIRSVLRQSYAHLEVILVNDGSKDDSERLCLEYQARDRRVIYLSKTNGGLSSARNYGLGAATGDYVIFLDSDDFFRKSNAIETLVYRIMNTGADVLNYSYVKYYEDIDRKVPYFSGINPMPWPLSRTEQVSYLFAHGLYIASACNKMIRRSLFEQYPLEFEEGVFSEDIEWCCRLLTYARSFDFICENFYMYRQRSDSITHMISDKKCDDLKKHILDCIALARKTEGEDAEYLYQYASYQFGTFFITQSLAENWQKSAIEELRNEKWILKFHGNHKKLLVLYWMNRFLGYKLSCRMIRLVTRAKGRFCR